MSRLSQLATSQKRNEDLQDPPLLAQQHQAWNLQKVEERLQDLPYLAPRHRQQDFLLGRPQLEMQAASIHRQRIQQMKTMKQMMSDRMRRMPLLRCRPALSLLLQALPSPWLAFRPCPALLLQSPSQAKKQGNFGMPSFRHLGLQATSMGPAIAVASTPKDDA